MRNWWKIAKLELNLARRDKEAVVWSLIAPIAMAALMGTVFENKPPAATPVSVATGENPDWVGDVFSGLLAKRDLVITSSENAPRVLIPDRLIQGLVAGDSLEAVVLKRKASDMRAQQVSVKVREVMFTLAFTARSSWIQNPPDSAEVAALVAREGLLRIDKQQLGEAPRAVTGMVHQLPAMLVMFLLFQLMTFFMVLWVEDLKSGKIKRIVMSPTPMRDLFTGQLVSRLIWGLLQVVVILGVGSVVLRVDLDIPWAWFAIILIAYMVTVISFGLLVGTFFHMPEKASAVGVTAGLLMAALGGCWWPLEVVSEPMRMAAMALPTGLMMDAVGEFIAVGPTAAFPSLNFSILVLMSAVMMPIAIRRMRRQIMMME
jgi:ABC-type transport system involved in cytochrome c biogenesis permease component